MQEREAWGEGREAGARSEGHGHSGQEWQPEAMVRGRRQGKERSAEDRCGRAEGEWARAKGIQGREVWREGREAGGAARMARGQGAGVAAGRYGERQAAGQGARSEVRRTGVGGLRAKGGGERGHGARGGSGSGGGDRGATGGYLWGVFEGSSWALPGKCRLTETRVITGPELAPFCAKRLKRHLFWVHKK